MKCSPAQLLSRDGSSGCTRATQHGAIFLIYHSLVIITLNKLFSLSEPQFPPLQSEINNSTSLRLFCENPMIWFPGCAGCGLPGCRILFRTQDSRMLGNIVSAQQRICMLSPSSRLHGSILGSWFSRGREHRLCSCQNTGCSQSWDCWARGLHHPELSLTHFRLSNL